MAVRLPHLCVLLLLNWVALRGFGSTSRPRRRS
jgi:hypothetical protein